MTERRSRTTNRLRPLVAAALVACLVVGAAIPAAGLLADSPAADTATTDGSATGANPASADAARTGDPGGEGSGVNATASAGARLAGAIGGQQSETAGELETRTLLVRLGRADSPEERGAVLAVLEARTDARLASLRERRDRLRTADNRSLSPGAYAHLAATVSVEAAVTERLADRGRRATATLPAAVTAEYGLSATRFEALANDSRSVAASVRDDLPALGSPDAFTDGTDADAGLDAADLLDDLDDTVAPANRTDWPFDGNDSTLDDALDELGEDNESLAVDDVIGDGPGDSDDPLDGNATDGSAADDSDAIGTDADGNDSTLGDTLDGNVTDGDPSDSADGLLDDGDTGSEETADDGTGDNGTADDGTLDDGGLLDG